MFPRLDPNLHVNSGNVSSRMSSEVGSMDGSYADSTVVVVDDVECLPRTDLLLQIQGSTLTSRVGSQVSAVNGLEGDLAVREGLHGPNLPFAQP